MIVIVIVFRPRPSGRYSLPSVHDTHELLILILTVIFHYVFLSVF